MRSNILVIHTTSLLVALANALHGTQVAVPANLTTRVLLRDVVGYSLEPVWVSSYVNNSFGATLLKAIGDLTGKPPPIRVGGNTADQTYLIPDLKEISIEVSKPETNFSVSPAWYKSWANYWPDQTDLIYSLNFRDNSSSWANAQAQAKLVWEVMGDKLTMFELGNEIDHFINKRWRDSSWGIQKYIEQFRTLTGAIVQADWYRNATSPPKFQAGVFADPPWIPDQQDEIDDFDILNLTRAGLTDPQHQVIETYSVHLYPMSTCDPTRWHRMRLDLLSNHTVLWLNVSQYVPQVAAADAVKTPIVLGETNSVSCSGKSGISDTFGAALWTVDYVLMAASIGIEKTYFHLGAHSEYSTFTPLPYELKNETLQAGIRANWYGHYFVAKIVARRNANDLFGIAALPSANSSDLSGYAVYDRNNSHALRKVVLLDMGVWNGTEGLSNPSTLKATDGTTFSQGTRPSFNMSITTGWSVGQNISITRLSGPGTNAKSGVHVSGVTFDAKTGNKQGVEKPEYVSVKELGVVNFSMIQAEGILLEAVANQRDLGRPPFSSASAHGVSWALLGISIFLACYL